MSAADKIRSFATAKMHDEAVISSGLTYGDARDILRALNSAQLKEAMIEAIHDAAGCRRSGLAGILGWIAARKEILATLVYWHDEGHIDESWWDEARRLVGSAVD